MPSSNQIAAVAAAMGDPARINMLMTLRLDGVLSATELAAVANVAPSTASEHLSKLMAMNLIVQQKVGRQRLYSLADGDVCDLVDGVTAFAEKKRGQVAAATSLPPGVLHSRLCYDHLAGKLGCLVTNALFHRGLLHHGPKGLETTEAGRAWIRKIGAEETAHGHGLRCPLRLCRDWTEDAYHLGGSVAAALLSAFRSHDWVRVRRGEMEVILTPKGVTALNNELGLDARQVAI